MEEMYSAIGMPFSLGSLIYDRSVTKPCLKVTTIVSESNFRNNSSSEFTLTTVSVSEEEINERESLLKLVIENGNPSNICGDKYVALEVNCEMNNSTLKIENNLETGEKRNAGVEESFEKIPPSLIDEGVEEQGTSKRSKKVGFDFVPLWGVNSIRGRMVEMEDSVTTLPLFLRVPIQMLTSDRISDPAVQNLSHLQAHFFGVYDGHGGSQVANYCRERIHLALAEEMEFANKSLHNGKNSYNWQDQWQNAFVSCFRKVDAEVGGLNYSSTTGVDSETENSNKVEEPIASEAVGSTAVVAVVCQTHIIVANCGDSRAVLCRGKVAVPLSVDHKPNRDDELTRIEAVGGKVIYWDGYRVLGVLAMSRSIGDRYLKPYVIPDPEVVFVSREKEDECLILASDGLWDVMTNEEACDLARRRIFQWYKKYGGDVPENEKRAAQDASEYLSRIALQRGSSDNVSVIVVDLKAQRKFKKKT